jgi:hypothetical protein
MALLQFAGPQPPARDLASGMVAADQVLERISAILVALAITGAAPPQLGFYLRSSWQASRNH